MTAPTTFLLGLGFLVAHGALADTLPGSSSQWSVCVWMLPIALPPILAILARRALLKTPTTQLPSLFTRLLLRAPGIAVPLVFAGVIFLGGLPDYVERVAPTSWTTQLLITVAPLVLAEVTTRLAERRSSRVLEVLGLEGVAAIGTRQLPMEGFTVLMLLVLSAASDLLAVHRTSEVFFTMTSVGSTAGMILFIATMSVLLPVGLRFVVPVVRKIPRPIDEELAASAKTLRFRRSSIIVLDTSHRMVNAAMVGPLPWPRFLMLTDGLIAYLGPEALRGVIAHEVGHARLNHPGWLVLVFLLIPLLLLHPITVFDLDTADLSASLVVGAVIVGAGYLAIRTLAHRFEHEADIWSAEALGGAQPCIDALTRVGTLLPPKHRHKASFRHPSEQARIECLTRWQESKLYRNRFRGFGRVVRYTILGAVGCALVASVAAHLQTLPFDRAILAIGRGEFTRASVLLQELDTDALPPPHRARTASLREELNAARVIVPWRGPWNEIEQQLEKEGWYRGLEQLATDGTAAARPWFAIATYGASPSPLVRSVAIWCDAAASEQPDRAFLQRIERHLETFGQELPDPVRQAIAARRRDQ